MSTEHKAFQGAPSSLAFKLSAEAPEGSREAPYSAAEGLGVKESEGGLPTSSQSII